MFESSYRQVVGNVIDALRDLRWLSEDGDDDEDDILSFQSSYILRAGRGARRYGIPV